MNNEQQSQQQPELTFDELYAQLRRIAQQVMRGGERPSHTLPPTALVHEYLLKLMPADGTGFPSDQKQFSRIARQAAFYMRRILIDYARHRLRHHPESIGRDHVSLEAVDADGKAVYFADLEGIHDAIEQLQKDNPEAADVTNLRFFCGLDYNEIAQKMGVSRATAERRWSEAKDWLKTRLRD